MKQGKDLNLNLLKYSLSFLIAIVFSAIVIFTTRVLTDRILEDVQNQYNESTYEALKGYTMSVEIQVQGYQDALRLYMDKTVMESPSSRDIQNQLMNNKYRNPSSFQDVIYLDKEGIAYSQNGKTYDVSDRDYYKAIFREKRDSFMSGSCFSRGNQEPVIIYAQAIKDRKDALKGALCACIRLQDVGEPFDNINFIKTGRIFVLDQYGHFIYNDNENLLGRLYTPENPEYLEYTSTIISRSDRNFFITQDIEGSPICLITSSVPGTEWKLCVSFPLKQKQELDRKQFLYKLGLCVLSVLLIFGVLVLEFKIMDYFQKKQMVDSVLDPVTGLWNRSKFEQEAGRWLRKNPDSKFVLIESDIKGFKFLNQSYGEEACNELIKNYGLIIEKLTLMDRGIIGKGFADNFYSFFKITTVRTAMSKIHASLDHLDEVIRNSEIPFTPKFGISFYLPDSNKGKVTIQQLIGQAAFAKNLIKQNSQEQFAIFDSRILRKINDEQFLERHMEKALLNNEFFVMYQPKINLTTDKITGAEALVRWNSPELGFLPPDRFIPLFEKNGFVTKLDFYVYEEVFKFLDSRIMKGLPVVPISVNMSRNHAKPEKFVQDFVTLFHKYNVPARYIQIEILERSVMDNNSLGLITELLHKEGFSVAMDDFGSGESSLNMLTKIPIDVIKFDREFLLNNQGSNGVLDKKTAGFLQILVELSKHLDKQTVFEGVETEYQRDFLKSIKCDVVQGYFYSKPLREQEFITFMEQRL